MADRIHLPQALDANGDTVTDATAYFYDAGTSTPREVFSDEALTASRGTSLAAASNGTFGACYVADGVEVKVDVQDGTATSIPGYPNDQNGRFPIESISPSEAAENARYLYTAAGSSNAYTISATNTISAYANGQEFEFRPNHANTGAATLNVDSTGAKSILKYVEGSLVSLSSGDLNEDTIARVKYDGTQFVLTGERRTGYARGTTTSGSSTTIVTSVPYWARQITVTFEGVSLTGSQNILIRLSTGATFVTSGYTSDCAALRNAASVDGSNATNGFHIAVAAADVVRGQMVLTNTTSTQWTGAWNGRLTGSAVFCGGGLVDVGGTLDGVQVVTGGTFDAGAVSVRWEA